MARRLFLGCLMLTLFGMVLFFAVKNISKDWDRIVDWTAQISPHQYAGSGFGPPDYVFPGNALESDAPLPTKVEYAIKNTLAIRARFILNKPNMFFTSELLDASGTGFMVEPGIFISARHIFFITILELNERGSVYSLDQYNLPYSRDYTYNFYGTANAGGRPANFKMELLGMGDPHKFLDMSVFKADNFPGTVKSLEFEEKAELGETVYSRGMVPLIIPLNELGTGGKTLMDFINYTFAGRISAILTDMTINKDTGLKKIYRIETTLEQGFSGGPVLNKDGKVIGMTISTTRNFVYAISAEDLKLFLWDMRNKGRIPKK